MASEPELLQRLSRLETAHRRMKLAGLAVVVAGVAVLVMGQAAPQKQPTTAKVVEAERFLLRDKGGKLRGVWSAEQDGTTWLGVGITDGTPRGQWTVAPNGEVLMGLYGQDGTGRGLWRVHADGSTALELLDRGGKVVWRAP